jgi:hypothetical protein
MPWNGVEFKQGEAEFFFQEMTQDLIPASARPGLRAYAAYFSSPGTIVGNLWQSRFYYHLDAFLSAVRSIPDIIQACFGCDPRVQSWVDQLPPTEPDRRKRFQAQFLPTYLAFNRLSLSRARNMTLHGAGTPPVTVEVSGRWGVHRGGPTHSIPIADSPRGTIGSDPNEYVPVISSPVMPLEPRQTDFSVSDNTGAVVRLFPACTEYVKEARELIRSAQAIAQEVHGTQPLTPPPQP